MSNKNSDYYFLRGGGEMGELIRAKDWSKTPLGDPADWPQSLRTMVAVMLDNPFGMYIAWGSEYIQLYNDGYRPILGASKHPQALGISPRETFSEIWHIIESMFDGVMKGTAVGFPDLMLPLDRNGFVEECYFDFAYSPIRKDNGEVGGVLVTVIETTDKKRATEALKGSNARFINNIMQAPVAMCIFRGKNYVVEIANEQMLNLWGKQADQVMNKPIFEGLPEAKDQGLESLLNSVFTTGEKFVANERPVNLPRNGKVGTTYINFVYEALKEADATITGVVAIATDVTSQVLSRKKIEESETRLQLITDALPVLIAYIDKNRTYRFNNKAYETWFGHASKDITGKHIQDVLGEAAYKNLKDNIDKALSGQPVRLEISVPYKDGGVRWVIADYIPHFGKDNEVLGYYGVVNDVTAIKEAERLNWKLAAIVQSSEDAIISKTLEGIVTSWNPGAEKIFGYSAAEMIGKPILILIPPDRWEEEPGIIKKISNGETVHHFETKRLHKDGKLIDISLTVSPIKDNEGNITGASKIARDITNEKLQQQTLLESEEQFSTLADNMENLAWLADGEGWRYWYNKRWLEYTGLTLEEMQGWGWQKVHHPDHVERIVEISKKIWHTNETFELTFPLRRHDGEYRWFLTRGYPVTNKEGKIIRWIGTNTDIDEHKKAEEQFKQMAERMPQKVWTADALGNRNYFNQVMLDYTGLTFDELKDWDWKKIIHPDDWSNTKRKWEHSINTGEDFENENRLLRKDGKYLWHLVRATAVKDEKGRTKMWIGSNTEIQEQIELSETLGANLKRTNERMQTILQHAPDAVISIDEDGIIKSWNSEAELIFGWKEHEVIEKTLTETIIPKRYHEGHDMGMKHFLRTGEGPVINKPIELSAVKKNGIEFPVELKISTSKINDRYLFIGFIRDISIRKEAEETIQNKTNQLMEAQQLAHIGSWEWDVVANKIEWSDELFRIFGLTPQEFKADYDSYLKYVHPDDREYVNSIVQEAFKNHQPYRFFHKATSADGNIRMLSATGKVITDGIGNVIRMSGTAQDVTEQKNYEEELKISEERFYKIFDSNPVPMSLSEIGNSKIKYANNRFYNAFGYSKEEVIGRSSEELRLLDPEESKRVVKLIFEYLLEDRPLAEIQALSKEEKEALLLKLNQSEKMKDFEILYTRKNGEKFPALVSYEVIRIGVDSYTVTSYQDITERKKAEALLRSQNDQLDRMNKELESFAYISSHDLQEPLRKIQTFATRISEKEENNLSEKGKEMFSRMQDAAKRMQILIQDLLAYSRTATTERKFKTTDLNELIAEVKEDFKEELKEKHASIEADHLCDVEIIPFQFRQLMHNLIGNSLKFSNPAQPPHIKIKCEVANGMKFNNDKLSPQNKYCHLTLSDNGIGFEQQYCEKIFEVFQRLHGKNEYSGTGIGLSIVKKIVENHNGIITATGELNKGATFDIYIPAK